MKRIGILLIIMLMFTCRKSKMIIEIPSFEYSAINIVPQKNRPYTFTNNESAFYYGQTGKIRDDGHSGFHVMNHKYFDDYYINFNDQSLLRDQADSIKVYFDHLARFYPDGIIEQLILLQGINCLLIEFQATSLYSFEFMPLISGPDDSDYFQLEWLKSKNMIILAAKAGLNQGAKINYPPFLGIKFSKNTLFEDNPYVPNQLIPAYRVGRFRCNSDHFYIAVVVGNDKNEVKTLAETVLAKPAYFINKKKIRLATLLKSMTLKTNQSEFDKAFQWSIISIDQLIMNQSIQGKPVKGIYAGLPWFNNYWGRDTFISLPGALLTTGRLADAREVLASFAQFQQMDTNDPDFGRLPNQVTTTNMIYNTADGTPWFVRELWEYYLYSGDRKFLEQMYPVVERSIEGTLKYHTDSNYFLTHGDSETWMDAQAIEGPWSPRGNRAIEVQALWYEQLFIGSEISRLLEKQDNEYKWKQIEQILKRKIKQFYWDDRWKRLNDHLNADGSVDRKIRPNQILAITVPHQHLLTPEHELMVIKEVVSKLTYPYGVASLWQHDSDFYPYHVYPRFYPKDAAYHNGTVWGWLAGPVVTSLVRYGYIDLAYELLQSASFQILNWGAVGTLSELLDAIPRNKGKLPQPSGTVSQAWSIAEYLRNVYQDILGISLRVPERKISLTPRLPNKINFVECNIPLSADSLIMNLRKNGGEFELELNYLKGEADWKIELNYPETRTRNVILEETISPGKSLKVNINFHRKNPVKANNIQVEYQVEQIMIPDNLFSYLSLAVPQLDKNLKCLQPPPYPLLEGEQVKAWNPMANIVVNVNDPPFDDNGPNGRYHYPLNANFKEGILDVTHFQILQDNQNYYFWLKLRNLVQPGWHPEYGFQLTLVAIAIDTDGLKETGSKYVERNANYRLTGGLSYNRIIFIGGGLQIEDSKGKILSAYKPHDVKYRLGDIAKKTISFAIPKKYLGEYQPIWRFIVLVGAQDDRGGAGLGEFRNVRNQVGEWHGGGGDQVDKNCNIYDFIIVNGPT